jgi:hypothetical protein
LSAPAAGSPGKGTLKKLLCQQKNFFNNNFYTKTLAFQGNNPTRLGSCLAKTLIGALAAARYLNFIARVFFQFCYVFIPAKHAKKK